MLDLHKLNDISVSNLNGIGRVKSRAYASAGIYSLLDLIYHFPRAYENRANVVHLRNSTADQKCATVLTVATEPRIHNVKRGMSLLKFRAFDESASCEITYFNQNYLKAKFPVGSTFRFYGRVELTKNKYTMTSPAAEPWAEGFTPPPFFPVYKLADGLSQKQISQNIQDVLSMSDLCITDPLPQDIVEKNNLCTLEYALREIHMPHGFEGLAMAKKRLIFDEFFMFAAGLKFSGSSIGSFSAPACNNTDIAPLLDILPYTLTSSQLNTINDIKDDISKSTPMSRIVIGDVGCGKTICAVAAIYMTVKSGYQAALMSPTEILANQHYADISSILSRLGITCALLTGSVTPAKKKKIYSAMMDEDGNSVDVVIGTQALLSDGAHFARPGLVITDEQHRFGVNQRALLSEKNKHTHVLVMSATPIPRSLALVMYGDLKMSKITEMPPGRQRVDTFLVDESYRPRLDAFIRKNVDEGGQVYIVCPAVEENQDEMGDISLSDISTNNDLIANLNMPTNNNSLKAAVQYANELSERLPEYNIAFVHGKMKASEKDEIMRRFTCGEIQILVSTTVIEVGVNVPSACLMIVENAERFGLSQLHQLRGRVGRGNKKSYCVLVNGVGGRLGDTAKQRLETMRSCYNGFDIAEQDLKLRGPGDFLALSKGGDIRQSGSLIFKLADMCEDTDLMSSAFTSANDIIEKDPTLASHPALKMAAERMFIMRSDIIS